MTPQQWKAANPLPPGLTQFGEPLSFMESCEISVRGTADEIFSQLVSAALAMGLSTQGLPAGYSAPKVVDGIANGEYQIVGLTPAAPGDLTALSAWNIEGAFVLVNPMPISSGSGSGTGIVLPAGTVVTVSENLGWLNARMNVRLDAEDQNWKMSSSDPATATEVPVVTLFALYLSVTDGAPEAIAYCAAPAGGHN